MIRYWVLFGIIIYFSSSVYTQIDLPSASGGRAVAMGHAYVGVGKDYWSLFHNPAGIAGIEAPQAGVYIEQRFLLSALNFAQAGFVSPFYQNQAFGVSVSSFGFNAYQENTLAVAYGIEVLPKIRIGAQVKYANLRVQELGNDGVLVVQMGVQTQINTSLSLGFSAYNVNQAYLDIQGSPEIIPTLLRGGLAFQPGEEVLLVFDLVKDIDHPLSYRGGVEYKIHDLLWARTGISTEPLSLNLGLGLVWKTLGIDFASSYTERLGYSPHISLAYTFQKKSQ
jgi:hypothetical protein